MNAFRAALVLGLALLAAPAAAQERIDFGPFYYRADTPDRLYLDGPLDYGAAERFWHAINTVPDVSALVLNSTGGTSARDALVIADILRGHRLDTLIPSGAECDGYCAVIFLAGVGRSASGRIVFGGLDVMPPDDVMPLFNSEMARYGLPASIAVRLDAAERSMEQEPTPAERTALQRTRAEGLAVVDNEALPRLPNGTDFEAVTPAFEQIGEPQTAALLEFDAAGNPTRVVEGLVVWNLISDPIAPILGATIAFEDINLGFYMRLYQVDFPARPYVSHILSFSEFPGIQPDRPIELVLGVFLDLEPNPWIMFLLSGPANETTQTFFVPRLMSGLELGALDRHDQISILIRYGEPGGTAIIVLDKGRPGALLFRAVFLAWGALSATIE